ncbi:MULTISPECIES: lipoprotein-releasing ABC transporter permease subunit [Gammaproteobacteria]|uniref:lipoprotein-releasing ABC transporter permease subunit n=1 Tax=Gammaproteobacteria TaxID=1236 RepID=UPI000DCFF79D|nr:MULTISPECIES: lipoprotein-releasing ABC transporter permease subunit [Gammaproteobacteria]RTE86942.1 lipoprotein-releasing ABC transporter permease subunit [Aliidiomarina sp. B3213]TCZ93268.1 lipoprotein-releasing ABC transporter permease subunit [Lysobacter sp. N42]
MNLPLQLARRFRKTKGSNRYLNFISWSSSVGIGLGTAIMIILLSVMDGFEASLENELLAVVPHAEVEAVQGGLLNWRNVVATAEQHSNVIAAAPNIRFTGLLQQNQQFHGVQVRAIDLELEHRVSDIESYVSAAHWQNFQNNSEGILIGQGLAEQLGIEIGQTLQLMLPELGEQRSVGSRLSKPKRFNAEVAGYFQFGGELDFRTAFIHLTKGQEVTQLDDSANAVRLKLRDIFSAPSTVSEVGYQTNEYAYMHDWMRTEGHLYRDIELVKVVMYLVLVLVMVVASFNIVATLMMQVEEKKASIAILKTMGIKDRTLVQTFVWQGALSGIPGAIVGAFVGVIGAIQLPTFVAAIERLTGATVLPADIYFISRIPTQVAWQDVLFVTVVAIVASLLATIHPARKAAQVAPAESLRHR